MSNIGAVNSKAVLPTMPQARTTAGISADQKESMNKVLSQFDANNLSSADAKKITTAFKKIGVETRNSQTTTGGKLLGRRGLAHKRHTLEPQPQRWPMDACNPANTL